MESLKISKYLGDKTIITFPSGEKVSYAYPTCVSDLIPKIDTEKDNLLVGVNVNGQLRNLKYMIPGHCASVEPGILSVLFCF